MPQDPLTRESLLFVNGGSSNQLGTPSRTAGTGYLGNYYLRLDWSTVDRFRGVQGDYVTAENNVPQSLTAEAAKPLSRTTVSTATSFLATGQQQEMAEYLLEPDNDVWNNADQGGTNDMLRKWIQDPEIYEGDPYYSYFLEQGVPVGPSSSPQTVPAVFDRPGELGAFLDHTFSYLKPSESREERDEGGLEITIEPVYNFFLDSMPAYEQITSDIPEALLPNFYIFETELRNTGSQTYSPDYYKALSFYSRMDDWFVETAPGEYTESTTKSFYQAYVSSLQAIKNSAATYAAVQMQYNDYTKNVAVLHSDINAINRTNRVQSTATGEEVVGSGLSFLPFYNIVTVGHDEFRATEQGTDGNVAAADSLFSRLFTMPDFDAESFIDLLQMYIITFLEKGINSSAQFHAFNREDNPTQTLVNAPLYFDLSRRDAGAGSLPGVPALYDGFEQYADFLESRITENDSLMDDFVQDDPSTSENQYWERDNVILLRDYLNTPGWEEVAENQVYNPPEASSVGIFYDKIANGNIQFPMRNFEEVLGNQGARSETVLYKIDKRVVDRAGNILPNIVQTIYLSPRFLDGGPLQYIDSQVRYGVRYQYDIQQVRVVFGNQYHYDDLQLYFAGYAGYGRAVGNALGFYRATTPGILVDAYVSADIRPYYPVDEDTPFAATQQGYFGVAPSNVSNITLEEWNYMSQGSTYGDETKLNRVNLIMKRGFGEDGNPVGGAMTAEYDTPNLGSSADTSGGTTIDPNAPGDVLVLDIPQQPVKGSGLQGPETPIPGVEDILGFEQLQEETEQASGYNLDRLIGGIEGVAGADGLPPGVGDVLGGVLDGLGNLGPGTFGSSGPIDGGLGDLGGQQFGGFDLGGSFGALGGMGGQGFSGGGFGGSGY